jgi:hypothetical protein
MRLACTLYILTFFVKFRTIWLPECLTLMLGMFVHNEVYGICLKNIKNDLVMARMIAKYLKFDMNLPCRLGTLCSGFRYCKIYLFKSNKEF